MKINQTIVLVALVCAAACNNPSNTSDKTSSLLDLEKAKTSINTANQAFMDAVSRSDSSAVADLYHSEGVLMAPNSPPIRGADNLTSFFGAISKIGIKSIMLQSDEVMGNNDAVIETGKYEIKGKDGAVLDEGKYLVVWKEENGEWKLFRDIWNTNMPPPSVK